MASSFAAFGAYTLLYLPAFGDTEGLRLIVMAGVLILGSLHHRKAVVMADAGATLLVDRRTASPEANAPIEVTRDQIVCVRPRSTNKLVRLFRSEMWQVGPERIIVSDSTSLTPLLQRLTQEGPPS